MPTSSTGASAGYQPAALFFIIVNDIVPQVKGNKNIFGGIPHDFNLVADSGVFRWNHGWHSGHSYHQREGQ